MGRYIVNPITEDFIICVKKKVTKLTFITGQSKV